MKAKCKAAFPDCGVWRGVPEAEYHSVPICHSTALKCVWKSSAAHAIAAEGAVLDSPSLLLGSAVHCLVLEPDTWDSKYAVCPPADGRTKEGKAIKEAFAASCGNRRVVPHDVAEVARACAASVAAFDAVASVVESCDDRELSLCATVAGSACRARLDGYDRLARRVVDIKTTSGLASPHEADKSCRNWLYDLQGAFYLRCARLCDLPAEQFVLVMVETAPPHGVAAYSISPESLGMWDARIDELVIRWQAAKDGTSGNLCYPTEILEIGKPSRWS